jgi:Family of unknown function (DUF5989)
MGSEAMNDYPLPGFEDQARTMSEAGILGELLGYVMSNKKWWLFPVLAMLFVFGLLILLSGSAAAPFIYTLF